MTVLPLASESRELSEPLMCEPLDSRELPEGKGVAGRRGQTAGHAAQAGAGARRGEKVPAGRRRAQRTARRHDQPRRHSASPRPEPKEAASPTDKNTHGGPVRMTTLL